MFCPNCGTQNPDTAQTCSKCSFNVKGAAQPKFKGTMLMMNQPQIPVPGAPQGPAAAPPGAPPAAAPPQAGNPVSGAPRPSGTGAAPIGGANKLKGTMVGVAPMAGGFGGPAAPFQPPAAAPARSAPPPAAAPRTPPPPGPGPQEGSGYSPPVPQAGVNPLGGTMAADVSPYQYAPPPGGQGQYGAPPGPPQTQAMPGMGGGNPQYPYGAPPPGQQPPPGYGPPPGAYGAPPAGPGAYGAPPQGPGAYGAPPVQPGYMQAPQAAYNQPPPQQGWGPPPEGYGQPPQGYPPQQGYGPPGQQQANQLPGGMVPYGGTPSASNLLASLQSSSGPTRRVPLQTLMPYFVLFGASIVLGILARIIPFIGLLSPLISLGCFAWILLIVIPMINEVKAVTRNPDFAWWPIFVPFFNMYWMWLLVPQEVAKAKQLLGVQQPVRGIVFYIFIWPFALASDINDMVR